MKRIVTNFLLGHFQVVFVNSAEDEMAMLAASGRKVEHHIPDWKERMQLQRLEITVKYREEEKTTNPLGAAMHAAHLSARTFS